VCNDWLAAEVIKHSYCCDVKGVNAAINKLTFNVISIILWLQRIIKKHATRVLDPSYFSQSDELHCVLYA
jgi:hypothetical protein